MANQPTKYKKFVATAATATLVASAIVPAVSAAEVNFTDIGGYAQDTQDKIVSLAERGIINGTSETTFTPAKDITRGQVVKILGRYLVEELGAEIPEDWATEKRFTDVDLAKDEELSKYAAVVFDAGVFEGNNGALEASKLISRQNMAVVLDRAAEAITGVSLVDAAAALELEGDVKDIEKAKESAREAILALNALEISTVENFKPTNNVSRANFATFLYNAIEVIAELADSATDLEKALAALPKADEVTAENAEESQELVDAAQAALDAAIEAEEVTEEEALAAQALIDAVQAAIDALEAGEAAIASVSAINHTTVEVKFNVELDAVTAENFAIEGGKVTSAKLSEDKKSVTLDVSGLEFNKEYTLTTKDIEVNAEAVEFAATTFKTPSVTNLWKLEVVPTHNQVAANGADNTVVEFRLLGADGKVDKTAKDVVLDIKATFGNLANSRVTIKDGVGSVVLASEFSTSEVVSKVTAKVIEAAESHKHLIGEIAGEGSVKFVPTSATVDVDAVTFVDAESNQADRVVLYFDKEVSPATFLKTTKDGKFVTEQVTGSNKTYTKQVLKDTVKLDVHQTDVNGDKKEIIGLRSVPGNAKAIEVILAKEKANSTDSNYLIDNSRVFIKAKIGKTENEKTFTLTDARQPEVTSVTPEGLKELKVKFSESVSAGKFTIDGLLNESDFTVKYGDFDAATGIDYRDVATITLGNYLSGRPGQTSDNLNKQRYFAAGNHTLVVTELKDFAGNTDPQNISTSQALGFNVAEDKTAPVATTTVESPEQFRLSFDKKLGSTVPSKSDVAKAFKVYDTTSKKYVDVFESNGSLSSVGAEIFKASKANVNTLFEVKQYENDFVIELTEDWTQLLDKANDAYYNYQFQFKFAKDSFVNDANGIGSAEMELNLNYSGSPLNAADNKSPEISSIEQLSDQVTFKVSMNEPVKLYGTSAITSKDDAGATLAVNQTGLAQTLVEFQGKDKDGKNVIIPGKVIDYSAKQKGADKAFDVAVADGQTGLQTLVDTQGYSPEWKVVVKSISDDVGNTAATLEKAFTLTKEVQANAFEIIAKENDNLSKANAIAGGTEVTAYNYEAGSGQNDKIEITFTKAVNHTDGTSNVTNPSLWTLNGQKLTNVASITVVDADGDLTNGNEKVIITFNNADVLKSTSNTISINKDIVSKDGTKLTGYNEIVAKTNNVQLPIVATSVAATGTAFTGGVAAVTAVKAEYSFTVTADATNGATAGTITLANVATAAVPVTVTAADDAATIAAAIKTALDGAAGSLYDVTVDGAKVTLTAKAAAAITNDPTVTPATTDATVSVVSEDVEGVTAVAGVAATGTLQVTNGATANGNVGILIDGVQVGKVAVTNGQTAAQVAALIGAQVYTDYTTSVTGDTVTFTAKATGTTPNTKAITVQDVR